MDSHHVFPYRPCAIDAYGGGGAGAPRQQNKKHVVRAHLCTHISMPSAISPRATAAVAAGTVGPGTPFVGFLYRAEGICERTDPGSSSGRIGGGERALLAKGPVESTRTDLCAGS